MSASQCLMTMLSTVVRSVAAVKPPLSGPLRRETAPRQGGEAWHPSAGARGAAPARTECDVAVVIVNWNSGAALEECLTALQRQTAQPRRVIVVDNGSTDVPSRTLAVRHPEVDVLRLSQNVGFAAASNLAVRRARAHRWIALLNADATPESQWLAELVAAAEAHPEYAIFSSQLLRASAPTELDGAGDVYHVSGAAWRRGHRRPAAERHRRVQEVFSPCAAAAMYRRDAFLAVGGFDVNYFCYFEDVDLGFRLRLTGRRCLHVPRAVARHAGSASTGVRSDFSVYHGHRNLVWTYYKNMPGLLFWLYLPEHLLFNLATLVWFSLRGQTRVIFRSKWDALRGLGRLRAERRRVQALRTTSIWRLRRAMAAGWSRPYLGRRA